MRKALFIVSVAVVLSLAVFFLCRGFRGAKEAPSRAARMTEGEEGAAVGLPGAPGAGPSLRDVTALARSTEEGAGKTVAGFIGSSRPAEERWEAARAAATEGTASLVEPLEQLFREGEPRAKIMAAYAMKGLCERTEDRMLGRTLSDEAVPLLSEMAATYLDPQIQRDSWTTLGYVDPGRALGLYRQQGEMPYAVEERAILSIGQHGGEDTAEAAVTMFDEAASGQEKVSACRIVGMIGARRPGGAADRFMEERGLAYLREVAADREADRRTRRAAIAGLGDSRDTESLSLLHEMAAEYPRETARAIEQIRSTAAVEKTDTP